VVDLPNGRRLCSTARAGPDPHHDPRAAQLMDAPAWGRCVTAGRARLLRSLRATVALKAGRGVSKASSRARPRAERLRLALDCWLDSGFEVAVLTSTIVSRLGLAVASSHARGRTRRASPAASCIRRWRSRDRTMRQAPKFTAGHLSATPDGWGRPCLTGSLLTYT